jgi:diguanylate cyclase (GGDEF)-like protein/PAS domain S-box-containing protein
MIFSALRKSYRIYFIFLFLVFGVIIALLTSVVNYKVDMRNMQAELTDKAENELTRKQEELTAFTKDIERYLVSLRNSSVLHTYIRQPNKENRATANQLFYAISNTNSSLMQVRFIDSNGMEKIRIDWNTAKQWPDIVKEADLQNKADRYYFIEASQIPANSFWYSNLDLNVEHKKIEIPPNPVLRIASPVYIDQQCKGIVIINIHARGFLQKFKESPFFNIALVDHEGHYLLHYQEKFSWSRYLQTGHTLAEDYPYKASTILQDTGGGLVSLDTLYTASLASLLKQDHAHLLLIPKNQAIHGMKMERQRAMFLIIGTILLFSVPLSFLISRIPSNLNKKINRQNTTLQEKVDLIDQNIITSTTDSKGVITDVSTAFCRVSGFSKKELIGQKTQIVEHPDMPVDVTESLKRTVQAGQTWKGELHNRSKGGSSYWTDTTIFPKYNDKNDITGYTTIYHDSTDKKRIEKLSLTDVLTGLHNRRSFNETLNKELSRAMRDKKMLGFAMLDIDYFKQYNDHYGHQKGDEVLRAIGQTLKQTLGRSSDFCYRLGGEEFGVIFSNLSANEALSFTEIVRKAIENLAIEHLWGCEGNIVTASFGLLSINPAPGITVDTIYQKADQALYQAKEGGRNRVSTDMLNQPG